MATTSATLSQCREEFAASAGFALPMTAVAPTPVSAVLTKSLLDQASLGCRCFVTFSSCTRGGSEAVLPLIADTEAAYLDGDYADYMLARWRWKRRVTRLLFPLGLLSGPRA